MNNFKQNKIGWRKRSLFDYDAFKKKDIWGKIKLVLVASPLVLCALFLITVIFFSIGLPDVRNLDQYKVSQSTIIYDRNGDELYSIHGDENRESVEIFDTTRDEYKNNKCHLTEDMCALSDGYKNVILATIAIEDDRFFKHHGFDAERLLKAVASQFLPNVKNRGGSTITQQYIKNALLSPEKKLSRKIKEFILAVKIENVLNKEEILELYLNKIPYGSNAYGVELASRTYFNKKAKDLTLAEAAILASLPNAPTRYSPYGNYRYAQILRSFKEKEIGKIQSEGDLELDEFVRGLLGTVVDLNELTVNTDIASTQTEEVESAEDEATEEEVVAETPKRLTPKNTELGNGKIYIKGRTDLVLQRMFDLGYISKAEMEKALEESWDKEFIRARENIRAPHFVLHIREILEEKYGKEVLEQGGLKVHTTLDYKLQEEAEKIVNAQIENYRTNYDVSNTAVVSMNVKTGEVLAMVGSSDYFDEEIDGNVNMTMSYIQPGSSFKPIVYALAYAKGKLQPATILYDVETNFGGGNDHIAKNFDGKFLGPISVRKALGQSRNVTAIKAYLLAGSQENIIPFAKNLGIKFLDEKTEHGSSLALGSAEITLFSLVEGFRTIANYGVKSDPIFITKIENNKGEILDEIEPKNEVKIKANSGSEEGDSSSITVYSTSEKPEIYNALDPQASYLMTNTLADEEYKFGGNLRLAGWEVATKTGTSNKRIINNPNTESDDKILPGNLLTVGYTTEIITGVWSGNSDGAVLKYSADGYNVAAPIWKKVMTFAHKDLTPNKFKAPSGITLMEVSKASGLLPNPETTPSELITTDIFASYAVPQEVEDRFKIIDIDSKTKKLWTENCPVQNKTSKAFEIHKTLFPEYADWQAGIDKWAKTDELLPPEETCDSEYENRIDELPTVQILAPYDKAQVPYKPFQVYAYASSPNGISKVEFYMGDILQYHTSSSPYIGTLRPSITVKNGDKRNITVRAYDQYGFSTDTTIEVRFDETLNAIIKPENLEELYKNKIVTPEKIEKTEDQIPSM